MGFSFLVVDDEKLSRSYIHNLIREYEPYAEVMEARSAHVALPILEAGEVDILFLDIKMAEMDGFELLASLSHRNFELVFVTAYSQYAIKAIREDARDYLLKPIKKTDFRDTLQKVVARRKQAIVSEDLRGGAVDYLENKLSISHQQGFRFVSLKDILFLRADNTYTTIYLDGGEKITTSQPISRFEHTLDKRWFFRIHKSFIINLSHFKEYISNEGGQVVMANGDKLHISRYRLSQFQDQVKRISVELKIKHDC